MDHKHMIEPEEYAEKLFNATIEILDGYSHLTNGQYSLYFDTQKVRQSYSLAESFQDIWTLDKMGYKHGGIYVDIGAGDGVRKSSSFMLSSMFSWKGLVIEPLEKYLTPLYAYRYNSTIVPYCVYNETTMKEFTRIDEIPKGTQFRHLYTRAKAIEGISETLRRESLDDDIGQGDSVSHSIIQCKHIQSVLDEYSLTYIDYLIIDTDGSELVILKAIDFSRVQIAIIHMNIHGYLERTAASNILERQGYDSTTLGGIISWHRQDLVEVNQKGSSSRLDNREKARVKSIYNKEYERPSVRPRDCPLPSIRHL